jgi:hypothetical protein
MFHWKMPGKPNNIIKHLNKNSKNRDISFTMKGTKKSIILCWLRGKLAKKLFAKWLIYPSLRLCNEQTPQ